MHIGAILVPFCQRDILTFLFLHVRSVKDGVFRQYRGSRDKESFINFVEEKKWQTLESVSSWKAPQSIQ